jgi:hypothetical protein
VGYDFFDCGYDVGVGAAAADIAAHEFSDFIATVGFALGDQAHRRTDLTGRAIAALKSVMIDKRLLYRVQRAIFGQTLNGCDLRSILHGHQCQAGIDSATVHQNRTGAALTVVATFLRSGESEVNP